MVENGARLLRAWDANTPFELFIDQIEDAADFVDAGGQPYTPEQMVTIAHTLIFKTGIYFDDCKTWRARLLIEQTWPDFKLHFHEAVHQHRIQADTMRSNGCANYVPGVAPPETAQNIEHQCQAEALMNLATATAADRTAIANMTASPWLPSRHSHKQKQQNVW